ncbi:hypothetical protein M3667_15805 [Microbacterium sp. P26]|uniref:hypothetical protein n=1 Tax=Microbacterium TaxID=33882 RepID=UPI00203F20C7|nr:hypothetical protein [Microbacterium sp. P26]MCM3503336.1 hypothetical protein [Microbacterium sp. P26]
MNDIRTFKIAQFVCLPVWIGAMFAVFAAPAEGRLIWLVLWIIAAIVFFVAFWRAMWLSADPVRDRRRDDQ